MDVTTFDKAAKYMPGRGYERRNHAPTSIVVHSTSSLTKNTAFAAEASFLYTSALVSAHYLIGKDGAVVRFLDPRPWAAWHAGSAQIAWQNQYSIGIELHHSVGDPGYPHAQIEALAALLRSLWALFNIPIERIETHGQIALPGPYKRKTDPSDWSHDDFLSFRAQLGAIPSPLPPPAPARRLYRMIAPCAPLTARSPSAPLAAGVVFAIDDVVNVGDEGTQDGWLWVSDKPDSPPGIGWIPSSYARPI